MRLIHYSRKKFDLEPRMYDQSFVTWQAKPLGLWVSVEGPDDWKSWCEGEEFQLENLKFAYEVKLKKDSNLLYINSPQELLLFTKSYPFLRDQWKDREGERLCATYELDWLKVKKEYQGIIISEYFWDLRLANECFWYGGWDCSSGCIWDLDCIEELRFIEERSLVKVE